jgi:hypothetical protein
MVALVLALAGEAAAKPHCCWRAHASAFGSVHVDWGSDVRPGAQNGTYDLTWDWAARELVAYFPGEGGGSPILDRIQKRNDPSAPYAVRFGETTFNGSETASQWTVDSNGNRVDDPPCSYSLNRPWSRYTGARPAIDIFDAAHRFLEAGLTVGSQISGTTFNGEYEGDCNSNVPFYDADGEFAFPDDPAIPPAQRSLWNSFGARMIYPAHTDPEFQARKLKREEDYDVVFEHSVPLSNVTTDFRLDHTGTAAATVVVRFDWFPLERLQKEIDRLKRLQGKPSG